MNRVKLSSAGDLPATPGTRWPIKGDQVRIVAIESVNRVLVEDETGSRRIVRPGELQGLNSMDSGENRIENPAEVGDEEWERARGLQADLEGLPSDTEMSRDTVGELAAKWRVSRATVWRQIQRYRAERSLLSLVDRRPGPARGANQIAHELEDIIRKVARRWWLQSENATVTEIEPSIQAECVALGIAKPSRATIARRLRLLRKDPENFAGEARAVIRERTRLMRGNYVVAGALDVVQIDHTIADVFLIDPTSREPIGRPTLTVAIDVATRCVLGICLSLEAPSSLLVALCLEHAVFPKDNWISTMGSTVEWPMYGRMSALHSDNGSEFHSSAFRRGCDLNRIEVIYRPPATPRFGGHVERLIGTLTRRIRLLPGTSYSDLLRRRPRRAEARASLTMADLRLFLTEEIARYHHTTHRGIGMPPRSAWEKAWTRKNQVELPALARDRMKFLLDFLPAPRRVVGREGIELFGLKYSHSSLAPHVNLGLQRVIRYDPRDISRIYLELPAGQYLAVPLRDRSLPPLSLWEWRAIKKFQRTVATRGDGEQIGRAILCLGHGVAKMDTPLHRKRRAARRAEWQAIQTLQALPVQSVSLSATLASEPNSEELDWEILE